MLKRRGSILAVALALSAAGLAEAQTFDWATATPESQGMSGAKLTSMKDTLAARGTSHLLVIRNDKVVYEWYVTGQSRTTKHGTASLAKALVGGVSLGVAIHDGRIALDDLATKYVPQWAGVARKSQIKVRHLGSHTAGIEDAEQDDIPHDQLTGWKGDFWKRLAVPNDPFTISRDKAPCLFTPGSAEAYSNPGIAMLTYCVTASLKAAPVKDIRTLLRDRVMRPVGAPDAEWSCGYGQTFTVDGLPLVGSWGGGSYSPNATARVARLMLRKGNWQGTQLMSSASVAAITTDAGTPGNGAQGWWTNSDGTGGTLPADAFWGAGAGHQVALVVPGLNLIAVRNGNTLDGTIDFNAALRKYLFDPLMAAVLPSGAPYPQSTAITGVAWAGTSTIVRKAKGSDIWPLTWADDGHLYGAYGDGNGFEPFISTKLSLGYARVEGPATGFAGYNIRSATGETVGDGASAKKAAGILMLNGTLYLFARNADNNGSQSQLAWSTDHAKTWTWSGWKFAEFGYCSFVNFGQNYAGARDGYVYAVSHDNPSAYAEADRFILMRVPKDQVKTRASWQFFRGRDASGNPIWTSDVALRGSVFTHAGRCRRSQMTYNAPLRRYLWWQMYHVDGVDNRFNGGFGVYDAPEPWGPWTTVYFTNDWDVGPGETGSFPPKWMSSDGKTVYLAFSGDDAFSVRKATLTMTVTPPPPTGFGVTIDSVSTGKPYSLGTANAGALYYIDRSYTVGSLSPALAGQKMIRTANDDKFVTASAHLKFSVSAPASVYVCYDKRATSDPGWLKDGTWTLTSLAAAVSDAGASPLRVYTKSVGAGQATLGGNHAGGNTGALSNYFVIVKPSAAAKEAEAVARALAEDVWEHTGDADGDGLADDFEQANFLDPLKADSDGDGEPDETELSPAGKTFWEEQTGGGGPDSSGGDSGGACGALGIEALLVVTVLRRLRALTQSWKMGRKR